MFESVARSATVRVERPSPQNSTNLLTTPCLRSISVSVSTRSVAVDPVGIALVKRMPTTTGAGRYIGWPSMQASASMPPTPQPSTPRPLTIVVCESAPPSGAGLPTPAGRGADLEDPAQVLEVYLVADAHAGGHDGEVAESLLRPAQQGIALAVALVLTLDVVVIGPQRAEHVDLDRVVDDQVDR